MKRYIWLFPVLLILPVGVGAQSQGNLIRQWGVDARATSEYGSDDWSAMQATGAPSLKACEDNPAAWASETVSTMDALTVFYQTPVFATEVNIYQSFTPGAITSVELIPADGSSPIEIPNSFDPGTPCPGVFNLAVPSSRIPVFGVRIWLDQSLVGDWNEIDAVQLIGNEAVGVRPVPVSSIESAQVQPDATPPRSGSGSGGSVGRSVSCDDGGAFNNGVAVTVVQMRSGFNYTATAVGLNGFDPVLAVVGEDGTGLCTDDDSSAAIYSANLPTTGQVAPSGTSSQVPFANTSNSPFANIDLVVGGYDSQPGEFLLILEGMTFSSADNAGDGFSVEINESVANSGVDVTAYVISVTNAYDPLMLLVDADFNVLTDAPGNPIYCDDAGNSSLCWGESFSLSNSFVSRTQNRQLGGGPLDAMLKVPVTSNDEGTFYNFLVNGAQNTFGDYVMVFHIGIN